MKNFFALFLLFSLLIPQTVFADGVIIPPPDQNITQAQQRALIVYQNGKEDLIISLEFSGNAKDFAWFLPVPSRPEIRQGEDEIFTKLGEITKPKKNLLEKIKGEKIIPLPLFGGVGRRLPAEEKVEVIETKRVGILDVTVLTATKAADLEEWLKENGYQIPGEKEERPLPLGGSQETKESETPSEVRTWPRPTPTQGINKVRQIFQEYLDKGWYFVAAKIATEFLEKYPQPTLYPLKQFYPPSPQEEYFGQAHITPLHLTFKTEKIIYPMKITSLNSNSSPSVLLYLLSDHKKTVSNYRYDYIEQGDEESKFIFKTIYAAQIKAQELKEWLPRVKDGYLTKLYASYLSPSQMKEDLRFENAKDDKEVATGEMRRKDWMALPFYLAIYGPIRIWEWFSRQPLGYYPSSQIIPFIPLILFGFLGGISLLWVIIFYFLLSRTRKRFLRAILYLLQFPGVWVLVNLFSLIFVIPCLVILLLLKVEPELIFFYLLLKNNLGSIFFTAIFYPLQSKLHLIFKKKR